MGGHHSKIDTNSLQSTVERTVAAIKDHADFHKIVSTFLEVCPALPI